MTTDSIERDRNFSWVASSVVQIASVLSVQALFEIRQRFELRPRVENGSVVDCVRRCQRRLVIELLLQRPSVW